VLVAPECSGLAVVIAQPLKLITTALFTFETNVWFE